jgi:hypothetical protein
MSPNPGPKNSRIPDASAFDTEQVARPSEATGASDPVHDASISLSLRDATEDPGDPRYLLLDACRKILPNEGEWVNHGDTNFADYGGVQLKRVGNTVEILEYTTAEDIDGNAFAIGDVTVDLLFDVLEEDGTFSNGPSIALSCCGYGEIANMKFQELDADSQVTALAAILTTPGESFNVDTTFYTTAELLGEFEINSPLSPVDDIKDAVPVNWLRPGAAVKDLVMGDVLYEVMETKLSGYGLADCKNHEKEHNRLATRPQDARIAEAMAEILGAMKEFKLQSAGLDPATQTDAIKALADAMVDRRGGAVGADMRLLRDEGDCRDMEFHDFVEKVFYEWRFVDEVRLSVAQKSAFCASVEEALANG